MGLLEDFASGTLGVRGHPPASLQLVEQDETSAELRDPVSGLRWWFFFFPKLRLDLRVEHFPLLLRDARRQTRALFDWCFAATGDASSTRSRDWEALVELERIETEGGTLLSNLHRTYLQPGLEQVMGHTLIPVAEGVFEARWAALSRSTGARESMIMVLRAHSGSPESLLSRAEYDDPQHDALVPGHPLSLARGASTWWRDTGLRITAPPPPGDAAEVRIPALQCTVLPPPRFLLTEVVAGRKDVGCAFHRCSFSGTDAVDGLWVMRHGQVIHGADAAAELLAFARSYSAGRFESSDERSVSIESQAVRDELPAVSVRVEADPPGGGTRLRSAGRFALDGHGQVWSYLLDTTVAVPAEELDRDLETVAHSRRQLSSG